MDYVYFIVIILALIAATYFLRRSEKKTKNKYKKAAYRLLDAPSPARSEIINTIKCLRLYGGTWRKDKEFVELVNRLRDRLDRIDASDT
jgi:septation ring formation regulator EzrA